MDESAVSGVDLQTALLDLLQFVRSLRELLLLVNHTHIDHSLFFAVLQHNKSLFKTFQDMSN
jgi:hypothetical protein